MKARLSWGAASDVPNHGIYAMDAGLLLFLKHFLPDRLFDKVVMTPFR